MSAKHITLKAKRIVSASLYNPVDGTTIVLGIFHPAKETIKVLQESTDEPELNVSLEDEMGLFCNDRCMTISQCNISEDGKAASVILVDA